MATITLKNPQKDVFLFTLYHSVYCANGKCSCTKQRVLRSVTGGLKYFDIVNPASVHLEGYTSVELESSAEKIQQVNAAIKSGRLIKVEVEARDANKKVPRE